MVDPGTLATLENTALTQGIAFLYGQATELLKRRRERSDAAMADAVAPAPQASNAHLPALAGELNPVEADEQVVESRSEDLLILTEQLSSYVNGTRAADPSDPRFIAMVEALRGLLELVYRQRITIAGETREPTGSTIDVKLVTAKVDGELTVAQVGQVRSGGKVTAAAELGDVGPGAKVTGFRADIVGG